MIKNISQSEFSSLSSSRTALKSLFCWDFCWREVFHTSKITRLLYDHRLLLAAASSSSCARSSADAWSSSRGGLRDKTIRSEACSQTKQTASGGTTVATRKLRDWLCCHCRTHTMLLPIETRVGQYSFTNLSVLRPCVPKYATTITTTIQRHGEARNRRERHKYLPKAAETEEQRVCSLFFTSFKT